MHPHRLTQTHAHVYYKFLSSFSAIDDSSRDGEREKALFFFSSLLLRWFSRSLSFSSFALSLSFSLPGTTSVWLLVRLRKGGEMGKNKLLLLVVVAVADEEGVCVRLFSFNDSHSGEHTCASLNFLIPSIPPLPTPYSLHARAFRLLKSPQIFCQKWGSVWICSKKNYSKKLQREKKRQQTEMTGRSE